MHQVLEHFTFLISATNHHGVHSPFVYDFVTRCLYDRTPYPEYDTLKTYRAQLLKDLKTIKISERDVNFKTKKASKSRINISSDTTYRRAKLLFRLARYGQWQTVLELGTTLGITTQAMALGNPKAQITSLDGCSTTAAIAEQHLSLYPNINIQKGTFNALISKYSNQKFDAIFINGHHIKTTTVSLIKQLFSLTHNDTIIIIDGIHINSDMTATWKNLKNHPKVTVSIDCFSLGFLFFRREQRKQHFKIRL